MHQSRDARQIALDVFNANFLKLSESAGKIALIRTQEITEKYLNKLFAKDPALLQSMEDPDMQYALFTAQKEYARTGDSELADLLVDILVDRTAQTERSVLKIALNESLEIAPKLTVEQYNVLSIIFVIRYTKRLGINNIKNFGDYLRSVILPFTDNIRSDDPCFQHLDYAGCGSVQLSKHAMGELFRVIYPGLFWRGAHPKEIEELKEKYNIPSDLIIACHNNSELFQFKAIDEETLKKTCENLNLDEQATKHFISFQKSHLLNEDQACDLVLSVVPELKDFFGLWNSTSLSRFTLTSVGIAIAHANIRRRIDENFNINIWVY